MDLFTDLYNKVMGFFRRTDMEETSKDTACNRLRVVLMQDRTNLNPQLLERMRTELIELLSKYVEMDKEALELNFEQEGEQMALMLSIPVLRAKSEEDIEKALKEEKEKEDSDDAGNNEENAEEADESQEEAAENSEEVKEESKGQEKSSEKKLEKDAENND